MQLARPETIEPGELDGGGEVGRGPADHHAVTAGRADDVRVPLETGREGKTLQQVAMSIDHGEHDVGLRVWWMVHPGESQRPILDGRRIDIHGECFRASEHEGTEERARNGVDTGRVQHRCGAAARLCPCHKGTRGMGRDGNRVWRSIDLEAMQHAHGTARQQVQHVDTKRRAADVTGPTATRWREGAVGKREQPAVLESNGVRRDAPNGACQRLGAHFRCRAAGLHDVDDEPTVQRGDAKEMHPGLRATNSGAPTVNSGTPGATGPVAGSMLGVNPSIGP